MTAAAATLTAADYLAMAAYAVGKAVETGGTPADVHRAVSSVVAPVHSTPLRYELAAAMGEAIRMPYLVRGLVDMGTTCCVYGDSGAGKSCVAMELALAVATGREFLGRRTARGAVLYLAGEGGRGLRNRIVAARLAAELPPGAPLAVVREPVLLDPCGLDAVRVIAAAQALATETGEPVYLIVVDTLARAMVGDENSTADMSAAIRAIDTIREATGACVLIVHHAGKDATRGARGSSALRAALDSELLITVDPDGTRVLTTTKQRDLPTAPPVALRLESVTIGTDTEGEPITAPVLRDVGPVTRLPTARGKQQQRLLAELQRLQDAAPDQLAWSPAELREIGRGIGQRKESARDAVTGLTACGALVSTIGGSYLASWSPRKSPSPEPYGRHGRIGANHPISPGARGGEEGEGSIDPALSPRTRSARRRSRTEEAGHG